jgi:CO/xanthine dehydrogenase FAD-binding subunit
MLYNLKEVHRPAKMEEALDLLQRTDVRTLPLAGGTALVGRDDPDVEAVVDLAGLGLSFVERGGGVLRLGATVTLQTIVDDLPDVGGGLLAECAHRMAGWHVRNAATLGGSLVGGGVHSPLSVALAALGAQLEITGQGDPIPWPDLPDGALDGQLITAVQIGLPTGALGAAYEQVARTDADQPIVCAAGVARDLGDGMISARTVVGGLLADSLRSIDLAVERQSPDFGPVDALSDGLPDDALVHDFLGGPDYRRAVAPVLARRALDAALAALDSER